MSATKGDEKSKYRKKSRKYKIKDKLLFFKDWTTHGVKNILVIPKTLINIVLKSYHESIFSAHFGITKTLAKLKEKYYWPTMIQDTNNFIKICTSCQLTKKPNREIPGLLQGNGSLLIIWVPYHQQKGKSIK